MHSDARVEVGLYTGGPSGFFFRAYFHGVHPGKGGQTTYTAAPILMDNDEFEYAVLPALQQKVNGVWDKPDRHRHCVGQFVVDAETAEFIAQASPSSLALTMNGSRKNTSWEQLTGDLKQLLGDYVGGRIGQKELLQALRARK